MDCPVCHSTLPSDASNKCPNCNADLDGILLTYKIEQTAKRRLLYGAITTALLAIFVLLWIIIGVSSGNSEANRNKDTSLEEFSDMKAKLEESKNENIKLKVENKDLTEKLKNIENEIASRHETYIVQPGESLFVIARKILGNGYKYVDIAKDNNISDPNKLVAGQQLIINY